MQETSQQTERTLARRLADVDPSLVKQIRQDQVIRCIRNLMDSAKINPDQAMNLLKIPNKERKSFRTVLQNGKASSSVQAAPSKNQKK